MRASALLYILCFALSSVACQEPAGSAPPQEHPTAASSAPKPPAAPTKEAPQAPKATPEPPAPAPEPALDPRWPRLEADAEGAVKLGQQLGQMAQAPEFGDWLAQMAAWPLELDGAAQVERRQDLPEALKEHLEGFGQRAAPHTTCQATQRQALLEGQPWHNLDRLGQRPPQEELARDLDRLGLVGQRWWINCFHEEEAGYSALAQVDAQGKLRLRAIRD